MLYQEEVVEEITGLNVDYIRLAGNSLIIYLECQPGDLRQGFSIWLEPTWHLRDNKRVITGSRAAQTEDDEEHERICKVLGLLVNNAIRSVDIDPISNDFKIELDQNYYLITFVTDPSDEESWHIRDYRKQVRLTGNPKEIRVQNDNKHS